jgi:hypothetical protein
MKHICYQDMLGTSCKYISSSKRELKKALRFSSQWAENGVGKHWNEKKLGRQARNKIQPRNFSIYQQTLTGKKLAIRPGEITFSPHLIQSISSSGVRSTVRWHEMLQFGGKI